MVRLVLAIVLAPIFWGIFMFVGNLVIFRVYPEAADGSSAPVGYLIMAVIGSVIYSLATGLCSAAVAGGQVRVAGIGAGVAVLLVGVAVQLSYWDALPVWYHLTFLALLVPCTMLGAELFGRRRAAV